MVKHPILYEINTRCWLRELSEKRSSSITLANVPETLFAGWQKLGFTHIWLMGVWSSGLGSRAEALANPHLHRAYSEALPDWRPEDVGGSPYAIADYQVPLELGGEAGLKKFRQQLHQHGLRLLLDFVPNHVGLDHRWVRERPDLFVQAETKSVETYHQETIAGPRLLAHGKDPYFPAWTDTIQLDYRRAETRQVMTDLLLSIAERCDGVRCDMAMLLLSEVFTNTWKHLPARETTLLDPQKITTARTSPDRIMTVPAAAEFWAAAVPAVKAVHPDFLFLAEIYWGLEPRLQALGFDYTYDKALYDEILARNSWAVQHHLLNRLPGFTAASAHFLENHDEPRIASKLSHSEHRAAALLILGLPGMRFLHEGQLFGARRRVPVQLIRRFPEPVDMEIEQIYVQILAALSSSAIGTGTGELLKPQPAWPDNPTAQNIVVVQWLGSPKQFDLVLVNLAAHRSQCFVPITAPEVSTANWSMKDLLGPEEYVRSGAKLFNPGLFLDLPPHGAQLFHFQPA